MESDSPHGCDGQEQARETPSDLTAMAMLDRKIVELQQEMTEQKKLLSDVQTNLSIKIDHQMRELSDHLTKQLKEVKDQLQQVQHTTGDMERHMSSLRIPRARCEECTITQYTQKKKEYSFWLGSFPTTYSLPFYSHRYGYKFRLAIKYYYNGIGTFLQLMKGEYDDELPWPVEVTVHLKLLNQAEDQHNPVEATETNIKTWKKDEREVPFPIDGFKITYGEMEKQSDGIQYVVDDCFKFEVHITTN